ncbi:response regulator transcription factor [Nocardia sp. 348MFTsu5.1]|uniref:response regulator transcription factor n=1 Tax=Nocardia sp. 348MFTsu5.1 TaxID=1172185 RepID=UPI000372C370|nr:response regulator transcription factor [Nocardia sp. 348MFTsu5.1]
MTESPVRTNNRLDVKRVLVYSDDASTRRQIIAALGDFPPDGLDPFLYVEVATGPGVIREMDAGSVDLVILDGEAAPAGGMGIARQLKDEIDDCPPIVLLTGRPEDRWLAAWSQAEAVVSRPIDPFALTKAVVTVLRSAS